MCTVCGCGRAVALRRVWGQSPPNAGSVSAPGLRRQGTNASWHRGLASVRSVRGLGRVLQDGEGGALTRGLSHGCMEECGQPGCKRHLVAACGLQRLRGAVLLPAPPVPHCVCAGPASLLRWKWEKRPWQEGSVPNLSGGAGPVWAGAAQGGCRQCSARGALRKTVVLGEGSMSWGWLCPVCRSSTHRSWLRVSAAGRSSAWCCARRAAARMAAGTSVAWQAELLLAPQLFSWPHREAGGSVWWDQTLPAGTWCRGAGASPRSGATLPFVPAVVCPGQGRWQRGRIPAGPGVFHPVND